MQFDDAILWGNALASEIQRKDFTFKDARGEDEAPPLTGPRTKLSPVVGGPTRVSRAFAIIHLAMFDTMMLIEPIDDAQVYLDQLPQNLPKIPNAGPDRSAFLHAAIAAAAASVTQLIFENGEASLELVQYRNGLVLAGAKVAPVEDGLLFGGLIGRAHLNDRSDDGAQAPDPSYRARPVLGAFKQDPYNPRQDVVGAQWGDVRTFGGFTADVSTLNFEPPLGKGGIGEYLLNRAQFRIEAEEVRVYGAHADYPYLKRTAEQTLIGKFWGYDGVRGVGVPPRLYNQCLQAISRKHALTMAQNAVLFALANMAMADAGIACWKEKYTYHVARPVTGLRETEEGFGSSGLPSDPTFGADLKLPINGNSFDDAASWLAETATDETHVYGDSAWRPLGAPQTNAVGEFDRSPGFPAYPSGHSTFGFVTFEVARQLLQKFGKDPEEPIVFVSDEFNGRNVDSDGAVRPLHRRGMTLAQAVHENAISRVYLGVHWRMDAVEGLRLGQSVVELIRHNKKGPANVIS